MQRQDIRRAKFYHPGIGRNWSGYLSRTQFLRRPGVETTDCFICLDEVRKNQQQTFDMPCCGHIIHLKCRRRVQCVGNYGAKISAGLVFEKKSTQVQWSTSPKNIIHHCVVRPGDD